jgi:ATP-dependent protease ClpP protease subunit
MYRPNLKKRKKIENDDNPLEELQSLLKEPTIDLDKNHIYFYKDVTQESCLELNRKINDLNKELLKYSIEYDCPSPSIYLHINSTGGDLLSSFGTVDTILDSRVPIISIIEGCCASAASIIAMVCKKRYMTTHSFILIHQLSTSVSGKYQELKEDFENDTKFMEELCKLYKKHTKMTEKKIKQVLQHDLWWTSEMCIENGLVDGIWKNKTTVVLV